MNGSVVNGAVFAVPGDLATPTGGYAYDRRIVAELRALGWRIAVIDLGDGFPRPSRDQRTGALALLRSVAPDQPIVVDGLALGALPEVGTLAASHALIALVHHPLALESGLSQLEAAAFRASERVALAAVRHVIATSAETARILARDYAVAPDRVTIAPPGSDRVPMAPRAHDGTIALLAVGAIVKRKGYDVLLAALAGLTALPWRLTIVGDRGRDTSEAARLDHDIIARGLSERVAVAGAVSAERLAELYADAGVFVLASRFEGYGMAYAEAISHGIPVIGTTAGAIPETVAADAGILVPPDDVAALAAALRRLIVDRGERDRMAAAARAAAARLPTWHDAALSIARAIRAVM